MTTPSPPVDWSTAEGAAIADLFRRIKDVESCAGEWNGGDVVDVLSLWFSELGIDVEASTDQV
ncbi:hypothetical protein O3S80_42770 [Streptomyces sp. Lzd4kr]|nr:hypothetical protein [Streptomyces sp. Lzd4kr]